MYVRGLVSLFEITALVALGIIVFRGNQRPNLTALHGKLDNIWEKLDDLCEKLDDVSDKVPESIGSLDEGLIGEKLDDICERLGDISLPEHILSLEKAIGRLDLGAKLDHLHGELERIAEVVDERLPREDGGCEGASNEPMSLEDAAELVRELEANIAGPRKGGNDPGSKQ